MIKKSYVPPTPNRQIWPHLKGSAGGIIRHKSTRNKSTCKYWVLSTSLLTKFRNSNILNMSSSLLIQISSMRRINNVFASVIEIPLHLISDNRRLTMLCASNMTLARETRGRGRGRGTPSESHQTRMPFYIIPCCQKNSASVENYASDLHQVMILRLSRVGRTSCR
jgi:hypothetical protein